jgi:pantothenate kinase
MKQTAIEWLLNNIPERYKNAFLNDCKEEIEQVKAMEKEQMRLIYEGLLQNVGTSIKESDLPTFEQYYNETYNK